MKIWKEFGSSHSGNVSVIGTFIDSGTANEAFEMIQDFTLGEWEERHESLEEFLNIWTEKFHSDVKYINLTPIDYSLGVDNEPDIELVGNSIQIRKLRSSNVGGIVKLMLFSGAKSANVSNDNL